MKLWVDDIRPAPYGWTRAETISQAINLLYRYREKITHISLDHDISIPVTLDGVTRPFPSPDTFKVVAYYIGALTAWEENVFNKAIITTHSSNPQGRLDIIQILEDEGLKCTEAPLERANRVNNV